MLFRSDLNRPYLLPKADHGLCEHLAGDGRCGAYADRPAQCRAYDCIGDTRIWLDYDAMIPAPMPWWLITIDDWGLSPEERKALLASRFAAAPPLRDDEGTDPTTT